jgi:hypothetical protein
MCFVRLRSGSSFLGKNETSFCAAFQKEYEREKKRFVFDGGTPGVHLRDGEGSRELSVLLQGAARDVNYFFLRGVCVCRGENFADLPSALFFGFCERCVVASRSFLP